MKKAALIIALFFSTSISYSQGNERIDSIRFWFKQIEANTAGNKSIIYHDIENPNYIQGGSSEVVFHFDSTTNEIVKIIEHTYYDWHESRTSWYFHDSNCFFVFDESNGAEEMYTAEELNITEDELWQRGGEAKTVIFIENRMYFASNGECIRYLYKEKIVEATYTETDLSEIKNEELDSKDSYCKELKGHGIFLLEYFKKIRN